MAQERKPHSKQMWPRPVNDSCPDCRDRHVQVFVDWELAGERWVPAQVRVEPVGRKELLASELRLPFKQIFDLMRDRFKVMERAEYGEAYRSRFEPSRVGRPVKYGPEHWEGVRETRQTALDHGTPVYRAIETEFFVSTGTAKNWVRQLRNLGLIE